MVHSGNPRFDVNAAQWIAHRYERTQDELHFRLVPRDAHVTFPFLTEEYVGALPVAAMDRQQAVAAAGDRETPLHFIFHSAFCASTLLCRAFDRPGVAMGLSEPTIFNDIVGIRRRAEVPPAQIARLLDEAMALSARPWQAGEAVIVKPSNIINALAQALLSLRQSSRAVLLYAPLPEFLASVARKGMWCRLWARELIEGLLIDGIVDLGFTQRDLFRQTDLQIAAVGWLAQQRLFARLIEQMGMARVMPLRSDALLGQPAATLSSVASLFDLTLSPTDVAAIVEGPAFRRHSKFGQEFDADARAAEQRAAADAHGDEIDKVTQWAAAVAQSNDIPLTLGTAS